MQDEVNWENALSKGISFNDLDESQGNRTRNSLKDAFDELQVIFSIFLFNNTEINMLSGNSLKYRIVSCFFCIVNIHFNLTVYYMQIIDISLLTSKGR